MEVKRYSLVGIIRQLYREHVDYIRDNAAIEDYIREEAARQGLEQGLEQGIEQGREQGIQQGREQGIQALILDNIEDGKSKEQIISKLMKRFSLSEIEAENRFTYFEKARDCHTK